MIDLDRHLPGIVAGEPSAFPAWLAGAEPAVRDALRGFARRVDVEAVVQEALLRAWQLAPRVAPDGRPNALLRFTLRAARNLAVDQVRARRREDVPADDEALEAALRRLEVEGPAMPDPLLRRVIARCRELLPPQPRQALDARLAAGGREGDQAIAARLGLRVNTLLQNFTRARRALAECLERAGVRLDGGTP